MFIKNIGYMQSNRFLRGIRYMQFIRHMLSTNVYYSKPSKTSGAKDHAIQVGSSSRFQRSRLLDIFSALACLETKSDQTVP